MPLKTTKQSTTTLCKTCTRANVSCPIYPRQTERCVMYQKHTIKPEQAGAVSEGKTKKGEATMLVLTRREGETVNIGDDVRVTVLCVDGNQVRVGITAPKQVAVHREEVYQRIEKEKAHVR